MTDIYDTFCPEIVHIKQLLCKSKFPVNQQYVILLYGIVLMGPYMNIV